ncbi:hypothetical protein RB601_002819 [Gaeumannomyces tritici]
MSPQTRRMAARAEAPIILGGLPDFNRSFARKKRACRVYVRDPAQDALLLARHDNGSSCLLQFLAPKWGHCRPNPSFRGVKVPPNGNLARREDMQIFGGVQYPSPPNFRAKCQNPAGPLIPGGPIAPYRHLDVPVVRWDARHGLGNNWAATLHAIAGGNSIFIYEGQFEINGPPPLATQDLIFKGYMTCPVTDQCMDVTGFGALRPARLAAECGTNSATRNNYGIISCRSIAAHDRAVRQAGTNERGQNMEHLAAECLQQIVDGMGGPVCLMLGPTVIAPTQRTAGGNIPDLNWMVWPHRRSVNAPWDRRIADPLTPPVVFNQAKWATMTRLRTLVLEVWDFRSGQAQEVSFGVGARRRNDPTPNTAMASEDADTMRFVQNWFAQIRTGFAQQVPAHPGLDLLVVAGLNTASSAFDNTNRYGEPHHGIGPTVDWKTTLAPLLNPNGGKLVLVDFDQIENYDMWKFVEPFEN